MNDVRTGAVAGGRMGATPARDGGGHSLESAAFSLAQARLTGQVLTWPSQLVPSEATAYVLQRARLPFLTDGGLGEAVGYKIGATTEAMRAMLGLEGPCSGRIFAEGLRTSGGGFASTHQVAVECEIVVWLGQDLPCVGGECSQEQAGEAVAACGVAIEIVENRYGDFRSAGAPLLIADDFFAAGCVLGDQNDSYDPARLDETVGSIRVNGELRSTGHGAELMGHPREALAWLAVTCADRGTPLRRGEFVLLGSLTEPQWIDVGDEVVAVVEPLGTLTMRREG